jgi:hypothetical protein
LDEGVVDDLAKFVGREMCGSDCSCKSPFTPLYSLVREA